ncbi:hypothetical protein D3C80_2073260 [compost metagenome]
MGFQGVKSAVRCAGCRNQGDRFGPFQRGTFCLTEFMADAPAGQRIQFGVARSPCTQRLAVHIQAESAAVDLRNAHKHQLNDRFIQRAFF